MEEMHELRFDREGYIFDNINEREICELVLGTFYFDDMHEIVRRFNEYPSLKEENEELINIIELFIGDVDFIKDIDKFKYLPNLNQHSLKETNMYAKKIIQKYKTR